MYFEELEFLLKKLNLKKFYTVTLQVPYKKKKNKIKIKIQTLLSFLFNFPTIHGTPNSLIKQQTTNY